MLFNLYLNSMSSLNTYFIHTKFSETNSFELCRPLTFLPKDIKLWADPLPFLPKLRLHINPWQFLPKVSTTHRPLTIFIQGFDCTSIIDHFTQGLDVPFNPRETYRVSTTFTQQMIYTILSFTDSQGSQTSFSHNPTGCKSLVLCQNTLSDSMLST